MKVISVRQLTFLFLAFVPLTKVVILPSYLSLVSGHQAWISILMTFIIEGSVIAALLFFAKKVDVPFFDFLQQTLGKFCARIVFCAYAAYYVLKSFTLIIEQRSFIEVVLYETTPTVLNFLPFFFVAAYACLVGIKSLGRIADVAVWGTLASFVVILALSAFSVDFDALLPLFYGAFPKTLIGTAQSALWFGESTYILFFMGKIKWSKRPKLKVLSGYAMGALLVTVFFVVYSGIFDGMAMRNVFAIARTGKYSISLSKIGRIDFLAIFIISGVSVFALSTPLVIATDCICTAFSVKRRLFPALAITAIPLILTVFFGRFLQSFLTINTRILCWAYWVMSTVIPLIFSLIGIAKRRKTNEKVGGEMP